MTKIHLCALAFLLAGQTAFTAPKAIEEKPSRPLMKGAPVQLGVSNIPLDELLTATREALALPLENRLEVLRTQGPQGYRNLVLLMLDEKAGIETRWRAVTAIGRLGGNESLPELEQAMKRHEWYMRNAGLVALSNVDRP